MIVAVIAAAGVLAAVLGLVAWLVHGRLAAGDALVTLRLQAHSQATALADERDSIRVQWTQAVADLAEMRKAHAADQATLVRTARELRAATQELTDAKRLEIHGASDDDLAAHVLGLLQARIDADDARRRADTGAQAGSGDGDTSQGGAGV